MSGTAYPKMTLKAWIIHYFLFCSPTIKACLVGPYLPEWIGSCSMPGWFLPPRLFSSTCPCPCLDSPKVPPSKKIHFRLAWRFPQGSPNICLDLLFAGGDYPNCVLTLLFFKASVLHTLFWLFCVASRFPQNLCFDCFVLVASFPQLVWFLVWVLLVS